MGKDGNNYRMTKLCCYTSYISQAVVNCFLPLLFIIFRTKYGLDYSQLGTLIFMNFAIQLCVDLIAARYADKVGYRILLPTAHGLCVAGFCVIGVASLFPEHIFAILICAVVLYSTGGGLFEVLVSPLLEHIPGDPEKKASEMGMLHAVFSFSQVIVIVATTFLLRAAGMERWNRIPFLWAAISSCNLVLALKIPYPKIGGAGMESHTASRKKQTLFTSRFVYCLIGMMCAGAIELVLAQWASLFVETGFGVSKFYGDLIGPTMFAFMMGLGRVIYSKKASKVSLPKLLALGSIACGILYIFSVWPDQRVFNLIAVVLVGFCVGFMWPAIISICAAAFPGKGTAMYALLALFGDVGGSVAPYLAGVIADRSAGGLKAGILTGCIYGFVSAVCFFLFIRKKGEE